MSVVRYYQSYFMNQDLEMYSAATDTPALVRTMTLNEELGQISYIFSDKTGTLTCNNMDFRKFSCGGVSYGLGITEIGKASWKLQGKHIPSEILEEEAASRERAVPHVSFYDPSYEQLMFRDGACASQRLKCLEFFRTLAICHDVVVEKVDGRTKLSASNPDDEALVCAASYFGYSFVDREKNFVVLRAGLAGSGLHNYLESQGRSHSDRRGLSTVVEECATQKAGCERVLSSPTDAASLDGDVRRRHRDGEGNHGLTDAAPDDCVEQQIVDDGCGSQTEERIELLETIEFTSKRKRMSVIIREHDDASSPGHSHIRLLTKGADTAIIPRISEELPGAAEALELTMGHLTAFADEGLRCLLVCTADIPAERYEDWVSRYRAAKADLNEIEKRKCGEPNAIEELEDEIEQNLGLSISQTSFSYSNREILLGLLLIL